MLSKNQEPSMRHLLSMFLETHSFNRYPDYQQLIHVHCGERKVYKNFHVFFLLSNISQSVHFLLQNFQPSLSAALDESVMNENVFYVILHNIIVFNKQILVSLHLIVKRTSQNLPTRSRPNFLIKDYFNGTFTHHLWIYTPTHILHFGLRSKLKD